MQLIPDDEIKRFEKVQWAPMVDFLFIILIVFATMAITRSSLYDQEVSLVRFLPEKKELSVKAKPSSHIVNLSVSASGKYRWLTDNKDVLLDTAKIMREKIVLQQKQGVLPAKSNQVKVLLHIDKAAPWQSVAEAIFAMREAGFSINPVYQSTKK